MTDIEEFDSQLNSDLDRLDKDIKSLSKKDFSQKQTAIKKCQQLIKQIGTLIESYELEIFNLDKKEAQQYNQSLKQINQRFQKLKTELEYKKNEGTTQEELYKDKTAQQDITKMSAQQVIELGDRTQKEAGGRLQNIMNVVEQGNQLADEINAELDKQIEQLDRMHAQTKDTQTVLKRSQKLISYFARQIYTDKCIMLMMGLIFLAILVIMILSMLGVTGTSTPSKDSV